MNNNSYTPEQIIEWWKCCSMKFPGKDCGDCPPAIVDDCTTETDAEDFFKRIACRAAELLNDALEREKQRQWISVKDRLPEKEGIYLVFGVLDDEPSLTFDSYNDGNFDGNKDGTGRFTHWMPLPAPPGSPKDTP